MAYKFNEGSTTTIEKPTTDQQEVINIVEKRVQENSRDQVLSEVQKEVRRFDNSHTVDDLPSVYNEIDRQAVARAKKPAGFTNPFMGSEKALEEMHQKSNYRDLVSKVDATTEINEYQEDASVAKKSKLTSRMKLWLATGVFCVLMLFGLIICNALSIGNIERDITSSEAALSRQETELQTLEGQISVESNTIPEGMTGIENGQVIDITPLVETEISTSDNFFNKLARFIAYLFGR